MSGAGVEVGTERLTLRLPDYEVPGDPRDAEPDPDPSREADG
jgi:hypothetical protein